MQLTKWVHEPVWISKVRSFIELGPTSFTFNISNFFFLETAWPIEAKFLFGASVGWRNERLIKWTRSHDQMAVITIYGKTLKNHLLWNQKADDLESWYAALGAQVIPSLFKWWPWNDLDLFYGKVKFGPLRFYMGKRWNNGFFLEITVVYDWKVGRCNQLNKYMELYEYQRSRSCIDLGPNHWDSILLIFYSSVSADFNISSALIERYRTSGPLVLFSGSCWEAVDWGSWSVLWVERPMFIFHFGTILWTTDFQTRWDGEQQMSHDMTKPTKRLCAQRRLRSAWASARSD